MTLKQFYTQKPTRNIPTSTTTSPGLKIIRAWPSTPRERDTMRLILLPKLSERGLPMRNPKMAPKK